MATVCVRVALIEVRFRVLSTAAAAAASAMLVYVPRNSVLDFVVRDTSLACLDGGSGTSDGAGAERLTCLSMPSVGRGGGGGGAGTTSAMSDDRARAALLASLRVGLEPSSDGLASK